MHFIHKIQCFEEFLPKIALFFKNLFFPEFRSIEPVFRSIEIAIKIVGQPLSVLIGARLLMDQSKHFRSIESIFQSIENRDVSFFKTFVFTCSYTISNFFKTLFSLIRSVKASKVIFCCFPPKFLQGFSPLRPVRPFYPSFCIYFHVSCIKSCILGKF